MDVDAVRFLYGYNRWVRERLLATAEEVAEERTREPFGMSFDTILGTLAHLLGGETLWLRRWRGESVEGLPPRESPGSLPEIRERWRRHDEELGAFLAGLTPERLQDPVRYLHRNGKTYELPLWQLMVHIVNHGTHHRSELADMLTRAGHPPGETGFTWYCLERAGQE